MIAQSLREKFLSFFEKRGHKIIPSAPLVPIDDPTSLFISAGMQPLVPYLLGEPHPLGKRLADVQKCLRTDDIDKVGDESHHTFFEMLGNWSLGDYFKKEAISWSVEFLTKILGLELKRISVSVFKGDQDAPCDGESAQIWLGLGIPQERMYFFPKKDNWWGPVGETGPCGPCTEMYFDTGRPPCGPNCQPGCNCGKYFEIWNNVFMEYNKKADGNFEPLKQKNVDTGLGVERTTAILQGQQDNFQTELFTPIIKEIEKLSCRFYQDEETRHSMRIIADHLRAATFVAAEGIVPSNIERGYVLRRLIRRAIRHARLLGIKEEFTPSIAQIVVQEYGKIYPEIVKSQNKVFHELKQEEERFGKTLEKGLKQFEKIVSQLKKRMIQGEDVFHLYDTFGFPSELTQELAKERGLKVDEVGFNKAFHGHQKKSRRGAEKKFAGGLADRGVETTKLHTATHLLHAALRQVLGAHVQQKGSNITPERLRFDFSHPEKLNEEELNKVEDLVNQEIREDLPIKIEMMSLEEAKKQEALAFFAPKYGDRVKVYSIGSFSKEVCGGPHVTSTKQLGHVKIVKSKNIGSGIQRIYATLN